jgi:hypothetical protein
MLMLLGLLGRLRRLTRAGWGRVREDQHIQHAACKQ